MRPTGTDFAVSARSRDSVMSLGSIAHLQYYFARTGLLDGKGGQLARKKAKGGGPLDLSDLELYNHPSYALMGSSPGSAAKEEDDDFENSFADSETGMLDPTISTYKPREVSLPKPPTILELRAELESTLATARKALQEVRERKHGSYTESTAAPQYANMPEENTQGWYELQGMHILDVVTLAIRAAKIYYTAHEVPERLDAIKSEKQVRTDLLAVMETLKQMGIRNFKGGMRDEEIKNMEDWIGSVFDILKQEQEMQTAEEAERSDWTWMRGDWSGRERERERLFLMSMDQDAEPLPEWQGVSDNTKLPTEFLQSMQNGLRLVNLHNAMVRKSRRRYGAIPSFHTDTQKPYRCAENLRYWIKAAELRFEIVLKVDALGVVNNNDPKAWADFDSAILKWSRHVREELMA